MRFFFVLTEDLRPWLQDTLGISPLQSKAEEYSAFGFAASLLQCSSHIIFILASFSLLYNAMSSTETQCLWPPNAQNLLKLRCTPFLLCLLRF